MSLNTKWASSKAEQFKSEPRQGKTINDDSREQAARSLAQWSGVALFSGKESCVLFLPVLFPTVFACVPVQVSQTRPLMLRKSRSDTNSRLPE